MSIWYCVHQSETTGAVHWTESSKINHSIYCMKYSFANFEFSLEVCICCIHLQRIIQICAKFLFRRTLYWYGSQAEPNLFPCGTLHVHVTDACSILKHGIQEDVCRYFVTFNVHVPFFIFTTWKPKVSPIKFTKSTYTVFLALVFNSACSPEQTRALSV